MIQNKKILFFDGVCNLCNGLVRFVIKADRKRLIKFAPLQSGHAGTILESSGIDIKKINSVVYLSSGRYFLKSDAILTLFKDMGRYWKIFYVFIIVPRFLRDGLYDLVAAYRYRIFGRRKSCMVPTDEDSDRFI